MWSVVFATIGLVVACLHLMVASINYGYNRNNYGIDSIAFAWLLITINLFTFWMYILT